MQYFVFSTFDLNFNSWFMGSDALQGNGVANKILYLLRDPSFVEPNEPLRKVRRTRVLLFVAVQLIGFGATFAIVQTIGV